MKSSLSPNPSNFSMTETSSGTDNSDFQSPNVMKVKISHTNKLPPNKLPDPMLSPERQRRTANSSKFSGYTGLTKKSSGISALDKLMKFEKKYSKTEVQNKDEKNLSNEENKSRKSSGLALESNFRNSAHNNKITLDKLTSYKHQSNSEVRSPSVSSSPYTTINLDKMSLTNKLKLSDNFKKIENIRSLSQLDELVSSDSDIAYSDHDYISDLSSSNNDKNSGKASLAKKGDSNMLHDAGTWKFNKQTLPVSDKVVQDTHSLKAIHNFLDKSIKNAPNSLNREVDYDIKETKIASKEYCSTLPLSNLRPEVKLETSEKRVDNTFISLPKESSDNKMNSETKGLSRQNQSKKEKELACETSFPPSVVEEFSAVISSGSDYSLTSAMSNSSKNKIQPDKPFMSHIAEVTTNQINTSKNQAGGFTMMEENIVDVYKNEKFAQSNLESDFVEDNFLSEESHHSKSETETVESFHNFHIELHTVEELLSDGENDIMRDEAISSIKHGIRSTQFFVHTSEVHSSDVGIIENISDHHAKEESIFREHSVNYSTDTNPDEEIEVPSESSPVVYPVDEIAVSSVDSRSNTNHFPHSPTNQSIKSGIKQKTINDIGTSSHVESKVHDIAVQTDLFQPTYMPNLHVTQSQDALHTNVPEYFNFGEVPQKIMNPYSTIQYAMEPEVLEAMVAQKPVEMALNEMVKHQIDLTRHFMSSQYAMYEAYMNSVKMLSANYKPVTLEDTKKFIEEHRRMKSSS